MGGGYSTFMSFMFATHLVFSVVVSPSLVILHHLWYKFGQTSFSTSLLGHHRLAHDVLTFRVVCCYLSFCRFRMCIKFNFPHFVFFLLPSIFCVNQIFSHCNGFDKEDCLWCISSESSNDFTGFRRHLFISSFHLGIFLPKLGTKHLNKTQGF